MATYEQLPGKLNLAMKQGDTFSVLVDFSVSLTAHTVAAAVGSLMSYIAKAGREQGVVQ